MNSRIWIVAGAACACLLGAQMSLAQGVDKHVPAREKAPSRPPVATTVAPLPAAIHPVQPHDVGKTTSSGETHGIIFVGGKANGDKAAINSQPVPPGHAPVVPLAPGVTQSTVSAGNKAAINSQPVPPGHAPTSLRKQAQ